MKQLSRYLPFLAWFPIGKTALRGDLVAGITVALVLVPQSMAYAQLAGMPAHYGLYTAFLPVMVAAMWGSSHQLATGPVAVVSLLTASALAPLAATGSERFVALAIALTLLVSWSKSGASATVVRSDVTRWKASSEMWTVPRPVPGKSHYRETVGI